MKDTRAPLYRFHEWYSEWWKNKPNQIARSNAMAAFLAGWDARGRQ